MASSFPGAIDSFTDPLSNSPLNSPSHSAQHADLNDAAEKIETYVLNLPRGKMGSVFSTAGNVTLTTSLADIAGASVSFTAVSGRLYKVTYNAQMQKVSTNGYIEITITNGSNTNIYDSFTDVIAGSYINYSVTSLLTGLSGSVTIKARGIVSSGTATIFRNTNNPTSFSVEDIGLA